MMAEATTLLRVAASRSVSRLSLSSCPPASHSVVKPRSSSAGAADRLSLVTAMPHGPRSIMVATVGPEVSLRSSHDTITAGYQLPQRVTLLPLWSLLSQVMPCVGAGVMDL